MDHRRLERGLGIRVWVAFSLEKAWGLPLQVDGIFWTDLGP